MQEEVQKLQQRLADALSQGEELTAAITEYGDEVQRVEWQKKKLMAQARARKGSHRWSIG